VRGARLALAAAALGVIAGGATAAPGAVPDRATTAVPVREREYRLTPSRFQVAGVGLVRFRALNRGRRVHALAVTGPGVAARTANLRPGRSAILRVKLRRGRYRIYCPIHRARGMTGVITIGEQEGDPGRR
jgi:plastocyanin